MNQPASTPGFFDRPAVHKALFYGLVAACAALVLVDRFTPKHGHFSYERWFGFAGAFGFFAYLSIVTAARLLRRIVKRPEDYYGE